ncbi:MAG: 1-acyl-sn-glycerol-3-phosphate acyltransferase [Deltaproteobacteria bacterium]|nr:1-acyl-sn-glycerol-3-phosphate acyltransferase [Deltaproteobacteria bacterium]
MVPLYYLFGALLFPRYFYRYVQSWAVVFTSVFGGRLYTSGLERPPWDRPFVMVGNHLSFLDFAIAMQISPIHLHFIATKGLSLVPFVGGAMRLMQFVFIDRGSAERAYASIDEAARKIAEGAPCCPIRKAVFRVMVRWGRLRKGCFVWR